MIENLESRELFSATYFVAPTGSDNNKGTISSPFKTIQRAAGVAHSGDVVDIRAGTYRETVTPNSGVTFQAYNGEHVTISGANPVSGWTNYRGNIYSAPMSTNLGEGNNQLFVNGQAINEARYPNTYNFSHPGNEKMKSVRAGTTSAVIYDSNLNQPANYWKGAMIHMAPGEAWVDQVGTVTASSPGSITVSYGAPSPGQSAYSLPRAGNAFYLVGKFQSLDAAGEWYRDPGTGRVYVWTPNGGNPSGADVEAKARKYAFDLSHASNVTIKGVNLFAATIHTTSASHNVVINGITAQYLSQFFSMPNGWLVSATQGGGIELQGSGDVLENSSIAYSAGDGVVVTASGVTVHNNVIHDVDSIGGDLSGIRVLAGSGVTIDHNTVYNAGRDGIEASLPTVKILYNTVHDAGLQTTEAGGIYTVGTRAAGATIAYNKIYSIHTGGYGGTGIFLDNNSSQWNVHHNVTSDVDYAMKMNFNCNSDNIYNNTLGATIKSLDTNQIGNWNGTAIHNNVFTKAILLTRGANVSNNVFSSSSSGGSGAGDFSAGAGGTPSIPTPASNPSPSPTPTPTPSPTPTPTPAPTPSSTARNARNRIGAGTFDANSNARANGAGDVGYTTNGSYVGYKLNFAAGVSKLSASLATVSPHGTIEVRLGSPAGKLLGTLNVAVTGAWDRYTTQTARVAPGLVGVQMVYLVFKGASAGVANMQWLQWS